MKLCFVTILEPVNLPEIFDDALSWESTQKKTDNLNVYHELRLVSQKLKVRNFSKLIQNFVGTMGAFRGNFLLPVGWKGDVSSLNNKN